MRRIGNELANALEIRGEGNGNVEKDIEILALLDYKTTGTVKRKQHPLGICRSAIEFGNYTKQLHDPTIKRTAAILLSQKCALRLNILGFH